MRREELPLYVAGPMTGIKAFNYPAFDSAAADLRSRGLLVVSPSEMDEPEVIAAVHASPDGDPRAFERITGLSYTHYLTRNVKVVAEQVSGLVLLPGWQKSKGTRTELFIASLVGIPSYLYPGLERVEVGFELRHTRIEGSL